jgi:hypothetical protein
VEERGGGGGVGVDLIVVVVVVIVVVDLSLSLCQSSAFWACRLEGCACWFPGVQLKYLISRNRASGARNRAVVLVGVLLGIRHIAHRRIILLTRWPHDLASGVQVELPEARMCRRWVRWVIMPLYLPAVVQEVAKATPRPDLALQCWAAALRLPPPKIHMLPCFIIQVRHRKLSSPSSAP